MKKRKKSIFNILLAAVLAISIIISQSNALQALIGKDTLTMITSPDYPPYEYYDTEGSGNIIGFDIDIANYIAKELKFKLNVIESDFNGLIPALATNRVDFVMAGMSPTPERLKNVDFSIIYYTAQDTIVAPKGSNLLKVQQLSGKTVGVQLGSIQEKNLKEIAKKVTGIQIKQLNRVPEAIQELKSKRIDAAIIENNVASGFAGSNPDLEFNAIPSQENSGSAIAFAKNSSLVAPFNRVLQKMKDNGTLKQLATKWFSKNTNIANLSSTEVKTGLNLDFSRISKDIPFILRGIPLTLLFTIISVFLGLIWGYRLNKLG